MTTVKPRPSAPLPPNGPSEYDILKRNHRFLREDEHDDPAKDGQGSWDEALARKFYSNLWKEYAVCDLKHYKSGNFSLRWRTEDEVVSGAGESTCGNTRCKYHESTDSMPPSSSRLRKESPRSIRHSKRTPVLSTLELPFGYVEEGEVKSALVKVVLCEKCVKKIMWKREQVKRGADEQSKPARSTQEQDKVTQPDGLEDTGRGHDQNDNIRTQRHSSLENERRRRRHSRSRSPERGPRKDRPRH
ncbi:hypothetical protein M408DRAFT_151578 [Serendipita vermifera MAFF 305830]|uniref:Protein FRA10AC1 n=1 Tax=Serendipita vermifera MAFF 305830 TaxID=933852 RepID=A0A0C3B8W0_SERVB|nr:hypothetical protein M408DRAFT_151578 [Serendipita vermifera MAFF 305830]